MPEPHYRWRVSLAGHAKVFRLFVYGRPSPFFVEAYPPAVPPEPPRGCYAVRGRADGQPAPIAPGDWKLTLREAQQICQDRHRATLAALRLLQPKAPGARRRPLPAARHRRAGRTGDSP